ncbi:HNH endonuclease [Xanthomonas axonopodis]
MDVQPRAPEYGARRHHACHEVGDGRLAPLLATARSGGITEAAHILPYRGDHTDRVDNGLLLRADLHTLFDCLLLWITPENKVALAPSLLTTDYLALRGQTVRQPESRKNRPNPDHLREHARRCQELDGAPGS